MDGENNGRPDEQMDDLGGVHPLFLVQQNNKATLIPQGPSRNNHLADLDLSLGLHLPVSVWCV